MKLEEALKYRRKGYDIKRLGWKYPLNTISNWIKVEDIDADDWEVMRRKVAWPESWEALQQSKKVAFGDFTMRLEDNTIKVTEGVYRTERAKSEIPIYWLSYAEFEIVEDE